MCRSLMAAACLLSIGVQAVQQANFVMGTQAIYGPSDNVYNFTGKDALTEQTRGVIRMGANQFKMRLAPKSTCAGYHLRCKDNDPSSLKGLAQEPEVAAAFSLPDLVWYQLWLYSFANNEFLGKDWTEAMVEAEYNETKAWAVHMLTTYSGTGKTFFAGNWEGDWARLGGAALEFFI